MSEQGSVVDFYTEMVLPGLAERLDTAFPEFGWRRDARGWVATNEEMTHRVLGVRADRVVAHGPAPRGFLVHGGEATLWTSYVSGGSAPRGEEFVRAVKDIAERSGVDTSPIDRPVPRDRRIDLLHDFFSLCRWELAGEGGSRARSTSSSAASQRTPSNVLASASCLTRRGPAALYRRLGTRSPRSTVECSRRLALARTDLRRVAR